MQRAARQLVSLPGFRHHHQNLYDRVKSLSDKGVHWEEVVETLALPAYLVDQWPVAYRTTMEDLQTLQRVRKRLQAEANRLARLGPFARMARSELGVNIAWLKVTEQFLRATLRMWRVVGFNRSPDLPLHRNRIWNPVLRRLSEVIGEPLAQLPRGAGGFRWGEESKQSKLSVPDKTFDHLAWLLHLAYPTAWPQPTKETIAALKTRVTKLQ